jgi:hypothetical protein
MLGSWPVWESTFYPTRKRSANERETCKLSLWHIGQINFEKKQSFLVGHEREVRNIEVRIVDRVKLVVQIEKKKTVRGGVRR